MVETLGGPGTTRTYPNYDCSATIPDCSIYMRHWVVKYIQMPLAAPNDPPVSWNSYEFRYSDDSDNGFGELNYVRMPSGAVYTYQYRLENSFADTENIALYNSVVQKSLRTTASTVRWRGRTRSRTRAAPSRIRMADKSYIHSMIGAESTTGRAGWSRALASRSGQFASGSGRRTRLIRVVRLWTIRITRTFKKKRLPLETLQARHPRLPSPPTPLIRTAT